MAEFIEAELYFSDDDYLSLTELRGVFASGRQPNDDEMRFALAEIERRESAWGSLYPYMADADGVAVLRAPKCSLYFCLLVLSLQGTAVRDRKETPRSDALFDAISREAFRAWYSADAINFGWPPRDGRSASFPNAVADAARALGVGIREEEIPTHLKDAGVDVIAWRPFRDERGGFQIILIQNTVQWSFRKKAYDVRPLRWFAWLRIGALPSVGFAVPFAIAPSDPWWLDVTDGTQLVMDRGRLLEALDGASPEDWPEWSSIQQFATSEREAVRQTADAGEQAFTPSVPKTRSSKPIKPAQD